MPEELQKSQTGGKDKVVDTMVSLDRGDDITIIYKSRRVEREYSVDGTVTEVTSEKSDTGGHLIVRMVEDGERPRYVRDEYVLLVEYNPSRDEWNDAIGFGRRTPDLSDERPPDRLDDDYEVIGIDVWSSDSR